MTFLTHNLLSIEIVEYFWQYARRTRSLFFQTGTRGAERVADKRDIQRVNKRIIIRFGINEAERIAFTENVSMAGMFIKTPNVIPPNTRIAIEFLLPDGHKIKLEARVMWAKKVPANLFHLVKKSGMGVRFLRFHSGEDFFNDYFEKIATPL
jgi:hypothetical protein